MDIKFLSRPLDVVGRRAVMRELATDYFDAVLTLVEQAAGSEEMAWAEGVCAAIRRAVPKDGDSNFDQSWAPGLGIACDALRTRSVSSLAKGLALLALHTEADGEWSVRLEHSTRLVAGRLLLPPARRIARNGAGDLAAGELSVQSHVRGWLKDAGSILVAGGAVLPTVACGDAAITIVPDGAVHSTVPGGLDAWGIDQLSTTSLAEAVDLIQELVPPYLTWVGDVTRWLVPQSVRPNVMTSGTIEGHVGAMAMGVVDDPYKVAEMLIHESSHQYFNLAHMLGPIHDPEYTKEFYSPFPRKMRQLDRLLLAYHAFANVRLFYLACSARRTAVRMPPGLERDLSAIEAVLLEQRHHLTDVGLALWEPLAELGCLARG